MAKIQDPNWGACVKMTNGVIELLVTVDFGPRVIHLARVGMENMMYQDFTRSPLGQKFGVYEDQLRLYGGHRFWIAPEIMPRCYYPDNAPVAWEAREDSVLFTAPAEKINNIQKSIQIILPEDDPVVQLEHTVKNIGAWEIEFAPWCLTMLDQGGRLIIPMPSRPSGFLPNRNISLWECSEMNDERVYWGKNYITLTQNPQKKNPFKLGLNNEDGWAAYFNKGQVLIKFFDPILDGYYPDNGCCFESYTNSVMLECETLGELTCLEPGGECGYAEEWELYEQTRAPSNDEVEIAEIMRNYIQE
ncbi:MAG: hypothetical protein LBT44_07075 [Clostridiales bacterium]|nr:hypothetical protein [Clostridiales bacterium]